MPEVLDWQRAGDQGDIVQRAARALAGGQLVAFPTETVYGVAADPFVPEAIERLDQCKGRPESKPLALAFPEPAEALAWVQDLGRVGQRLARRCWPGPVTIVSRAGVDAGPIGRLTETVGHRVCPEGLLGLRVPAHPAICRVMEQLGHPLALTSANPSGGREAVNADEVVGALGDKLDMVVGDGPCLYGASSTVVRVEGNAWTILREGVIPRDQIERLTACVIVFVCTGNTCRSPLADALCKVMLAERLGCRTDELPRRGFVVLSAGIAAVRGAEAAPEAMEVARAMGADLSAHRSRPLSLDLARQADYLLAMTRDHLSILNGLLEEVDCRPRLLCSRGTDIPDPIGCSEEVYHDCARRIHRNLETLLPEVLQT